MSIWTRILKSLEPPKPKSKPKSKKKKKTKNTNTENKTVTFGVDKIPQSTSQKKLIGAVKDAQKKPFKEVTLTGNTTVPKSSSQKKLSSIVNKAKKKDKERAELRKKKKDKKERTEKIKKGVKTVGVATLIGGTLYGLSENKKKKAVNQEGGVGQGLPLKAKKTQGRSLDTGGKDVSRKKKVQAKPPVKKSYAIKSGDTLSQIARRRGTTLKALLAANPQIKNPNRIRVGQKINISSPVKNRKSVYQGLSKSQMEKMSIKKKHGGRITYRMTGGQVVDAGYD